MKIVAAGGIVQNDYGEVLLMYRLGKWDLPKGKQDEGETLEQCALREVEEETGLTDIELVRKINVTYHDYVQDGNTITKETHWYAMKVEGRPKTIPQTTEDIEEIRWVKGEELQTLLSLSYANIVAVFEQVGFFT
jgi:8-oxo-dGTP pyrophosphatase MutT (NUDIX family)